MIVEQTQGTFSAADAIYMGFGPGAMATYISGTAPTPPSTGAFQEKQFIGEIQQLGISTILDASMGVV